MSMYRDVERGFGVLDPILHVFVGGFQLPVLSVLSRMNGQYGDYASSGVSPLPILIFVAAVVVVIWSGGAKPAAFVSQADRPLQKARGAA
jgi:hypothetical protein